MLSKLPFDYSKTTENNIRILLNDGIKQKILKISLYLVKDSWYMDIATPDQDLLIGRIVNTWVDLIEILKISDKEFPNLKLSAIPTNTNGIKKEFNSDSGGCLQEILIIGDDN